MDDEEVTFLVCHGAVPALELLPWGPELCDAFVAVLDVDLLSDDIAQKTAEDLVRVTVDWVETMGPKCEFLHDLVDHAAVSAGKQAAVGDGHPMTAWHNDFSDAEKMASWVCLGGHGLSLNRLVIVFGPDSAVLQFALTLSELVSRDEGGDQGNVL